MGVEVLQDQKPQCLRQLAFVGEANRIDGQRVVMECVLVGNPAPTITWYKDGLLVAHGDSVGVFITSSEGRQKLTIGRMSAAHIGQYRCEAANRDGAAWTEAMLTLNME